MTTTETTEAQPAQEPRKRAKRPTKPKSETGGEATQETPAEPAEATPTKAPRKRKKGEPATEQAASATATLRELAESYLAHLEEAGKSEGTCFSYRMELRLALEALGEDTPVAKITQANVAAFFESEPVTRTRSGVEKSPLSVAKTRRVLRQALVFAVAEGLIEKAPLPEKA